VNKFNNVYRDIIDEIGFLLTSLSVSSEIATDNYRENAICKLENLKSELKITLESLEKKCRVGFLYYCILWRNKCRKINID